MRGRLAVLIPAFLIGFFGCLLLAALAGETVSIHLAFPRDLSVPIVGALIWLGFWTSAPSRPAPTDDWLTSWDEKGWIPPSRAFHRQLRRWERVERLRRGWTLAGATALAIALIFIINRFGPYRWVLS